MKNWIPEEKKVRVIINTDAKNEVDDQFAIVHAALTPSFDIHGFIPAHFGDKKSRTSMQDSHDEVKLLLDMMNLSSSMDLFDGATHALVDEKTPVESAGADLIIHEALKKDERPLHIAFLGPLTDMASAILMEPEILKRNVKVIWIGGGNWPNGGREYNLSNDIHAANVVLNSGIDLWQIPRDVYRMMPVSHAELIERVYPQGKLGQYLTKQLIDFNNAEIKRPAEYRVLGDSPAIGVILFEDCGTWKNFKAPRVDSKMNYSHPNSGNMGSHEIRVYQTMDSRFILEDFYAKLSQFSSGK